MLGGMAAVDLSAEIAQLEATAEAIRVILANPAGITVDPTQAGQFGSVILLLGGLGNVATLNTPAKAVDPEFPPTYNSDGQEINQFPPLP